MSDVQAFLKTLRINEVVAQLQAAPEALAQAMIHVDETRLARDGAREDLKLALANAEASAWSAINGDGKKMLVDERKARIEQAIWADPEVIQAREFAAGLEREHGLALADFERVKTQLSAARALEELAAATLNYVAAQPNGRK